MKKIYIVEGTTGEYEDREEWSVVAFKTKAKAKKHVKKANDWLLEKGFHRSQEQGPDRYSQIGKNLENPYDPRMYYDYTGVEYNFYALDLEE